MRLKLLLFLFLVAGILNAQQPYRNLVISEVRMDGQPNNHVELTNMGNTTIDLSEFRLGLMRPWATAVENVNGPYVPESNRKFALPEQSLAPGESFVVTTAYDFGPTMYKNKMVGFEGSQRPKQIDIYDLADLLIHVREARSAEFPNVKDSVTRSARWNENYQWVFETWNGRGCFFVEHHYAPGDSAIIDQVGGVFDNNGLNFANNGYDVAGVLEGTRTSLLVRKYSIKTGNPDFANARGVGAEDSEWMPVERPTGYNSWRDLWWTVGNHGPYVLDENTLESDVIDVDYAGKKLTVPWGTRRLDDIMRHMEKKPGVAWNYHLNSEHADSVFRAAKTGDKLTVYVLGNTMQSETFDIVVSEPTADDNIVVPVAHVNAATYFRGGAIITNAQSGMIDWPRVTKHDHGTDTITGTWYGIPNATRTDSLLKYLEKPANATWEFVYVDGETRPDLKSGDILKVTSQNGASKDYFIQVQGYQPSHNAFLSAITWPDIPADVKGTLGWEGDTIPGFVSNVYNYRLEVPYQSSGVPALIAKTQNLNAKVEVVRAKSLTGSVSDRTIQFIVTAEDDSVKNTYNVELFKEKDPDNLQPYFAEPFLSELVFQDQWHNGFVEIANPGNQVLDLSDYMFTFLYGDEASGITSFSGDDNWPQRYRKYIPGYRWVDEATWAVTPGRVVEDINVSPLIQPGDVFVAGHVNPGSGLRNWWATEASDVLFNTEHNPWNESYEEWASAAHEWLGGTWYMYKIVNDSIKAGLKAANDPNDFELIEVFGHADNSDWVIGGATPNDQLTTYIRKPHIYQGNTTPGGSFGTTPQDSEWIKQDAADRQAQGITGNLINEGATLDLGKHFMNEPTHYKSTVSSAMYKVSEGYSMEEEIRGVTTGTTVNGFLTNIIKAHEDQSLTVLRGETELEMNDLVSMDDALVVLSADSTNTSQYRLDVTEEGLSSDAVLTSDVYQIEIVSEPKSAADENAGSGIVSDFAYGTTLSTFLSNIEVPVGAKLEVIDSEGRYVSQKMLNYDTTYVDVTANQSIFLEVVAENGTTRIVYELQPNASEDDAFILSDVYHVDQALSVVEYIPGGTTVATFMSNITPSNGATVKIINKMGQERPEGALVRDDKAVVTSESGKAVKGYHLSMLRTQYVLGTYYLAYVTSPVYAVDQVGYNIGGHFEAISVADFNNNIIPAFGANAIVVDADGNEKTSGNLETTDKVQVTSADGLIVVEYNLVFVPVSAKLPVTQQINIYPNPTTGTLNIKGVEAGNRIQVYNINGSMVRDMKVRSNLEILSIDDQPAGMYLIVISNNNSLLGRYKAVKK